MVTDPTTGNPTTGPLLDWWYVHAGYMGFKDGASKSWDVPMGIEIEAQGAEKSDPILLPDRPWEKEGSGPVTSFYVKNGRYIIDYYTPAGLCRAESEDGYNWTKPELGAVEFEGSTRNNIITTKYARIFEDPSAPPDRNNHLLDNYAEGAGYGSMLYVGPGLLQMPDGRYAVTYWGTARKCLHDNPNEHLPVRYALWEKDRLAGIRAKGDGRLTLRQDHYRSPPDCPDSIPAPIHNRFPPLADPNEPPRQLRLNYKTETGGFVKVELITHIGPKPHLSGSLGAIDGYSFADCDVLQGDELDRVVTWKGNDNVAGLSDSLAIRIEMYKATLFAFSL